jgi:DNA repair protein RecN (Recombination protein N)
MLAIKLVLADRDRVQTYVFDEVDAGIGGVTADTIGLALAEVARHRQVLCITHLPGIAAFADHHFRVAKSDVKGRTRADITTLSPDERTVELARMIGGARVTKATRAAAAELLANARKRLKKLGRA